MWRVSGAFGAVRTTLLLGAARVAAEQVTVGASVGRFVDPRRGWTLSLGALVAGRIEGRPLGPGVQAAVAGSWLVRRERRRSAWPFVLLTGSLAGVVASGEASDGDARYAAVDLRLGGAAGRSLAGGRLTVYGAARVFGGPVSWRRDGERVVGGDRWHVTAGAGLTVRIPGVADLGLEALPLGEQGATVSVTAHL